MTNEEGLDKQADCSLAILSATRSGYHKGMRLRFFMSMPYCQSVRGQPGRGMPLVEWLDDKVLLSVAAENNLSETAYFVPRGNHYELRWFTPRCEVKLCGHATLASGFVLMQVLAPGSNQCALKPVTREH